MAVIESIQSVPVTVTEEGAIRIAGSRVSLESLLHHYNAGATPEQIACRESIEEYLRETEAAGDAVQARIESQPGYQGSMSEIRQRLMTRWSSTK